jgi:glycosyltransferase involved in cell wall biosynthesis
MLGNNLINRTGDSVKSIRVLFELAAVDATDDNCAAQRYATEIAQALSDSGSAKDRVVGGRRMSGPEWLKPLRRHMDTRGTARAIAHFKPDVVHRAGHIAPANFPGTYRLFSTFNYFAAVAGSASPFESSHGCLICPSESARNQASHSLGLASDRIWVVPPGVRSSKSNRANRPARGNYFLFVGPRSGSRNFDLLLQAVATTPTLSQIRVLACCGGPFSKNEFRQLASLGLAARVTTASGDDNALAGYYASALALVHPNQRDDFGLIVLAAMAHGCPVACSRTGSLPEVGGDTVLYFDPTDPADIATALVHLSADAGLRERLATAGRARAAQFTWAACAEKTLEGYRTLLQANRQLLTQLSDSR